MRNIRFKAASEDRELHHTGNSSTQSSKDITNKAREKYRKCHKVNGYLAPPGNPLKYRKGP